MIKLAAFSVGALLAVSGSAMAADLYVPPAAPVIAAAPVSSWDGPYIGVFAGYSWGNSDVTVSAPAAFPEDSYSWSGFQLGVDAGYNFHVSDAIVAGVNADIAWDNGNGSASVAGGNAIGTTDLNWTGSITGRLGVDVGGIVPYALAGIAFANATGSDDFSGGSSDQTFTGYVVGAGIEFALADNVSANVEYRYSNYGTHTGVTDTGGTGTDTTYDWGLSNSAVRVGLNYHF